MTNKTAAFLGAEYSWNKTQIELRDNQALMGGVRVLLPSFAGHQMFVTCYAPGGSAKKYKLRLGWDEKKELCALFVAHDFVTIESPQELGLPDEGRPTITLTNARRECHTVAFWAGAAREHERFGALYQALLALTQRTVGQRPMARRLEGWEKWLVMGLLVAAVALLAALAYFPARALVNAWWSTRFSWLFGAHILLMTSLLGALALLGRAERRRMRWDRTFTNPFMLAVLNLFFFLGLVGATGIFEVAIAIWRGAALPAANDERALYGALAFGAVFAAWLSLLATALVGERLLRWVDHRW